MVTVPKKPIHGQVVVWQGQCISLVVEKLCRPNVCPGGGNSMCKGPEVGKGRKEACGCDGESDRGWE